MNKNDFYCKDGIEYRPVTIIRTEVADHLLGNLLTYIEMLGLPEKQEEAFKGRVKQAVWGGCFCSKGVEELTAKETYLLHTKFLKEIVDERLAQAKNEGGVVK